MEAYTEQAIAETLSNYKVSSETEKNLYYAVKLPYRSELTMVNSFGKKTVVKEAINCCNNSHVTGWSVFRDNDDQEFGIAEYRVAVSVNNRVEIIAIGLSYYSKEVKLTTRMGEFYYDIVAIDGLEPIAWFAPHLKHLGLSK